MSPDNVVSYVFTFAGGVLVGLAIAHFIVMGIIKRIKDGDE